jgi:hypothetical protein
MDREENGIKRTISNNKILDMKISILETSLFKMEHTKIRLNHDLKNQPRPARQKQAFLQITTDMLNRDRKNA